MNLTTTTVRNILDRYSQSDQHNGYWDILPEYGEPGYNLPDSPGACVVLGYYWCQCDRIDNGRSLHALEDHHPRVWAALEAAGVQFEWADEWHADWESGKAYRTSPDSYLWQSSVVYNEDTGDILTPDSAHEDVVEWATNHTDRVVPATLMAADDLTAMGWTAHAKRLESGLHQGMTDTPEQAAAAISAELGPETPVLFTLDESSQFYVTFTAWTLDDES